MKETYSLEQVEKKFSGYNLLLPQSTDVQISPFYSYHVEIVPCDTSESSGDIFKTGAVIFCGSLICAHRAIPLFCFPVPRKGQQIALTGL